MIRVRLRLATVRARMANDARKCRIIRGNDMAIGAHGTLVGNPEPRVVESRAKPIRGDPSGMAGHTGGWVLRGNVIWHRAAECLRAQPRRLVASIAVGVRGRQ